MACLMEKEISAPLASFLTTKTFELSTNKQHHYDLNNIVKTSHDIVQEVSEKFYFPLQSNKLGMIGLLYFNKIFLCQNLYLLFQLSDKKNIL